jgi:hypothetical protein
MSTVNRAYTLVINASLPGGRNSLLASITDGNPISEKPCLMCGDCVPLRVYFRVPGAPGENSVAATLEEGTVIVMSGYLAEAPFTPLFTAAGFALSGEFYQATLDLNKAAIRSALESQDTIDVAIDFECRNAANSSRITYRANVTLYKEVFDSSSVPTSLGVVASPNGSVWLIGVTNDGQPQCTAVAPSTPLVAPPLLASPDGSLFQISATNDGQPAYTRIA